ncbi:MAG TPA: tetratricopeptide repeat protein [Lacunisphaera sp.]|nr:tetratricopeptide repeat protein [Lacunisphaera sp.]
MFLVAAGWFWMARNPSARLRFASPVRPDLSRQPAELTALVEAAEARVRSPAAASEGLIELGSLYHANGYLAEADGCWQQLQTEQPTNARWPYLQAEVRRRQSDYPAMIALLEKTTTLDPACAPAWLRLADHEFKTGRIEAAAAHYAKRAAIWNQDPYARLGLVRVAVQEGQREEARRQVEALVALHPRFAAARNFYAEMLAADGDRDGARVQRWLGREAGRFREADDPWLDGLVDWCRDPGTLQLLATVQFQTGRGAAARQLMERAIALAPKDPNLRESAGDLYLKLGDPAAARITLEAGLAIATGKPVSIPHYVYLNQACRQLRQPAEALRLVEDGLRHHPDAFELHNARGQTLEELNRPAEALAAYRRSVELSPNDAECNFNLATALLQREEFDEARRHLRQALTLQPTFPKALKLLAKLELAAGTARTAEEFLLPLYEAQTGDPQVRELMVEWHLLAGRVPDARKVLQEGAMIARTMGNVAEANRCEETLRNLP